MHSSCSRLSASLCLALLALTSLPPATGYAQTSAVPPAAATVQQETIRLLVGDILEILPVHNLSNAQYTWILTQDRTFIEASRARTFRKRIIQPGKYTLFAEVSAGDQTPRINRTFTLEYEPRTTTDMPEVTPQASASGITTLVTAEPSPDAEGRIFLADHQSLVRLHPIHPDITPLSLDTHTLEDSNGDGNPASDVENDGTFFQTDALPLTLWFASPLTDRPMALTAIGPTGAPIVQEVRVLSETYARSQGLFQSPVQIAITPAGNLTYQFNASFLAAPPATPILHHWAFGDGQQSILPAPTHTYNAPGTYTVTVRMQNLTNGMEIGNAEQELLVQGVVEPSSEPTVDPEPDDTPPDEEPAAETSVQLSTMLMIGGAFLGAMLLGLLLLAIFMKLRGRNLDLSSQFASMEETLLSKDGQSGNASQKSPTLVIPSDASTSAPTTSAETIRKREEEHANVNPLAEKPLKINEDNAPSWLKSGLSTSPAATPKPPAPQVPPVQKHPVNAPPVTPPVASPKVAPSAPADTASVPPRKPETGSKPANEQTSAPPPPWMQQKTSAPGAVRTPEQAAPPKPKTPPAPSSPPTETKPVSPSPVPSTPPAQRKTVTPPAQTPTVTPAPPPSIPSSSASAPVSKPSAAAAPGAPAPSTVPPAPPLVAQEAPVTPPWMQHTPTMSLPTVPSSAPAAPSASPAVPPAPAKAPSLPPKPATPPTQPSVAHPVPPATPVPAPVPLPPTKPAPGTVPPSNPTAPAHSAPLSQPAPSPSPTMQAQEDANPHKQSSPDDSPVAFIRAESLDKPNV